MPRSPGNSRAPCGNELVLNNDFEVGGFELADVNAADSCPTENSILASWSSTALNIVFSESEYGWSRELSFRLFYLNVKGISSGAQDVIKSDAF